MLSSLLIMLAVSHTEVQQPQTPTQRHVDQRYFQLKDLETAKISFKDKYDMTVWVMDNNMKRAEGMMFLKDSDFSEKQGMIFAFTVGQELRFWMRNTLVPLDIAYVDERGKILSTYTMKALDEDTDYSSHGKAKYAIEVKSGLFKKQNIQAGDMVQIPSTIKAKD
ncbi:MAG: DUF192 domain-containing protein [Fimbriimonadaceae bacterium]